MDPRGREVPEAQITLQEPNGRVVEAVNRRGGVRFCDLGLLPVNITVGQPECNQVSVKNIPLRWNMTQVAKVVYDDEECLRDLIPLGVCRVLFRFTDEDGRWIPGVTVDPLPSGAERRQSDTYGRLLVGIKINGALRANTRRQGYVSQEIDFTCSRDLLVTDRAVTLRRAQ